MKEEVVLDIPKVENVEVDLLVQEIASGEVHPDAHKKNLKEEVDLDFQGQELRGGRPRLGKVGNVCASSIFSGAFIY